MVMYSMVIYCPRDMIPHAMCILKNIYIIHVIYCKLRYNTGIDQYYKSCKCFLDRFSEWIYVIVIDSLHDIHLFA